MLLDLHLIAQRLFVIGIAVGVIVTKTILTVLSRIFNCTWQLAIHFRSSAQPGR